MLTKIPLAFLVKRHKAQFFLMNSQSSLALQAKLLRVLENGEYYRIGETQARKTEARVIAATNSDLKQAIEQSRFRADLYHRLGILTINVPPLRARPDDIPDLIDFFIMKYRDTFPVFRLSDAALETLRNYPFPGNIRELRNIVIRLGKIPRCHHRTIAGSDGDR